ERLRRAAGFTPAVLRERDERQPARLAPARGAGEDTPGLQGVEPGPAAEHLRGVEPAGDAEVTADAGPRAADAQGVARFECEGGSGGDRSAVGGQVEGGPEHGTRGRLAGFERRPGECELQREGVRRVADEGVADGEGGTVRGPAEGNAEGAPPRPAVVH